MLSAAVQINNTTYSLSDSSPLELVSAEGLGVVDTEALTERGPLQHGDSDVDFRLDPRIVNLVLQAPRNAAYNYRELRRLINRLFTPSNVVIVLLLTFDDGVQYALDTRALKVDMPSDLEKGQLLKAGVQLRAANPLFYNPTQQATTFGLTGGGAAFTVPTPVPTFIGTSIIDQTLVIDYEGDFKTFPTIEIYGPCSDPVLTNTTTGDKLDFTGITINGGEYYTIELRYGRKFVYKDGDTSDVRTGELTTDSDLATFAIESDPTVPDGLNSLQFTATGVNASTQVYVRFYENFTGV